MNIIKPPRVFISYAYDSERQVHEFACFLRAEGGVDVRFDLWDANRRQDWSVWIVEQVREADFVIVVASPAYKYRAEGGAGSPEGRGVQFEAALLRDPAFLQPYAASRYVVGSLTMAGVDELYRVITGQPRHRPPSLGRLVVLPGRVEALDERGKGLPVEG